MKKTRARSLPEKQLKTSVRKDSRVDFTDVVREQLDKENAGESPSAFFSLNELLKLILLHDAVNCAASLLEGDTGLILDPNVAIEDELSPLQLAARNLSLGLTTQFLMHGGQPNLFSDDHAKLPLCLALNALSQHQFVKDWALGKSIFKLLYIFCLKELKDPLCTIKLLAARTTQLEQITIRCIEEGELAQFAALVLAAGPKLVPPHANKRIEGCLVGQHILRGLQLLSVEENELNASSGSLVTLHERRTKLESAWKLLNTVEATRGYLELLFVKSFEDSEDCESYEVPFELASYMSYVPGVTIEPEDVYSDDVKCLMPRLTPKKKAWLNRTIERHMRTKSGRLTAVEKNSPGGTLGSRSFHTFQASGSNIPLGVTAATQMVTPPLPKFLSSARMCAFWLSTAKKFVK